MKVKIRNKVYNSEKVPIMLILSDHEKSLISKMSDKDRKFCSCPEKMDIHDVRKFMKGDFKCK